MLLEVEGHLEGHSEVPDIAEVLKLWGPESKMSPPWRWKVLASQNRSSREWVSERNQDVWPFPCSTGSLLCQLPSGSPWLWHPPTIPPCRLSFVGEAAGVWAWMHLQRLFHKLSKEIHSWKWDRRACPGPEVSKVGVPIKASPFLLSGPHSLLFLFFPLLFPFFLFFYSILSSFPSSSLLSFYLLQLMGILFYFF